LTHVEDSTVVAATAAVDESAFASLTERYRPQLRGAPCRPAIYSSGCLTNAQPWRIG
jgi:hypothetical protein